MAGRRSQAARAQQMQRILARKGREGLSWRELSLRTGVPLSSLMWWARKLRQDPPRGLPSSSELKTDPVVPAPSPFMEVHLGPTGGDSSPQATGAVLPGFELVLGRLLLRVPAGFHPPSLARLLQVLEGAC